MLRYAEDVPQIPAAAITIEGAEWLQRWQDRGERPVLRLTMGARTLPDALSRNAIAELVGRERPEEVVVLGGHIDSWDVGQGAHDDAAGVVVTWEAVRLLHRLGLRPRRTVRFVAWTNEENGLRGAVAYREGLSDQELADHVLALESDSGVFEPVNFGVTASDEAFAVLKAHRGAHPPAPQPRPGPALGDHPRRRGADIGPLMREGVPGVGVHTDAGEYFWIHHTDADTAGQAGPRRRRPHGRRHGGVHLRRRRDARAAPEGLSSLGRPAYWRRAPASGGARRGGGRSGACAGSGRARGPGGGGSGGRRAGGPRAPAGGAGARRGPPRRGAARAAR
jgi:hypothetical protein